MNRNDAALQIFTTLLMRDKSDAQMWEDHTFIELAGIAIRAANSLSDALHATEAMERGAKSDAEIALKLAAQLGKA